MLKRLYIKNAAIIPELTLEFCPNLNVLSGETGAGKSIILDSLVFVLGSKADKTLIRYGCDEMTVEAVFDIFESPKLQQSLKALGYDEEETLILTRTLSKEGRSDCRVNGRTVTASILKGLAVGLIDLCAQSEHISLFKVANQILLLDDFCGEDMVRLQQERRELSARYEQVRTARKAFGGNAAERGHLMELYAFQIEEIEKAQLSEEEEAALAEERVLLMNGEKIRKGLIECCAHLSGEYGAVNGVAEAVAVLHHIAPLHENLEQALDSLYNLRYELEAASENLEQLNDSFDFDERRADRIEERLDEIKNLKKKYGGTIPEILDYCKNTREELERLRNADESLNQLNQELNELEQKLAAVYQKMSDLRKEYAKRLEARIIAEFRQLYMPNAVFSVQFEQAFTLDEIGEHAAANGWDDVEFYFSANKGEPLKSLNKVISGGELSRFMLAVKAVTSALDGIDTMIFDEIDAGISGVTAAEVAKKIAGISRERQVVCITHSPAVAAMADRSFLISKRTEGGATYSGVTVLDEADKAKEVARLTGVVSGSDHAIEHARELIAWADDYKKQLN